MGPAPTPSGRGHGQLKHGVLGEQLVQTPQHHAHLPILVAPHDTGTDIVPAHDDTLHLQQKRWRPWCGGEGYPVQQAHQVVAGAKPQPRRSIRRLGRLTILVKSDHRMQQEAKRQQKVPLHAVSRRAGVPELHASWHMLWGVPHQPRLALGIQGKDGH